MLSVNHQLSAIFFFPIRIQVTDHGVLSSLIILKLIEVFFIKTSALIYGIMKLVSGDTCITTLVQVFYKIFHLVKKFIFILILMFPIEPINRVASYLSVMH